MATTATNHWKLGLFVLLAGSAMLGTLFWLGARRFHRESFSAVSYFDESVQGLDVGSPVKFRGVTIGTVSDITIAPDHRHVQVTADMYVDALVRLGLRTREAQSVEEFIPPNLRVQLALVGITGVRFIQTDFFDPERYPPPKLPFEPPWNYVPSVPSTLKDLEETAVEILNRLPLLANRAADTLVDLKKTLGSIDHLAVKLGAENGSFDGALRALRTAATRADRALEEAKLGATAASVRDSAASVRDSAASVGHAAAGVGDTHEELQASLVALREALEAVRTLADSLERDPSVLVRGSHADGAGPVKGP